MAVATIEADESVFAQIMGTSLKQADLSAKKTLRWWIWQFWPELLSIPHKTVGQL